MAYSPAENLYLSALTELQFPSTMQEDLAEVETDAAMTEMEPVQLAQAPSKTVTDAGPQITGEIKPVDPTVRQRMADFLQAGFERVGMNRYKARQTAQTLIGGGSSNLPLSLGFADIVPFLGTALQTQEAARMGEEAVQSAQRGDIGTAALQAGGAAVGMIPGAAGTVKAARATGKALAPKAGEMLGDYMRRSGMQLDLMAYHGTPHQFDKFDSSKIGTGQGAQAYGFGLYFAENKGVAKGYQTDLSSDGGAKIIASQYGGVDGGIEEMQKRIVNYRQKIAEGGGGAMERVQGLLRISEKNLEDLKRIKAGLPPNTGAIYTVDIPDAFAAKMLDFDAPLRQQSQEIQALARKYNLSMDDLGGDLLAAAEGKTAKGAQIMREAGVPGVRYLDQGSRGDGKGTRNIVVFPGGEDQIKIIKKEGAK